MNQCPNSTQGMVTKSQGWYEERGNVTCFYPHGFNLPQVVQNLNNCINAFHFNNDVTKLNPEAEPHACSLNLHSNNVDSEKVDGLNANLEKKDDAVDSWKTPCKVCKRKETEQNDRTSRNENRFEAFVDLDLEDDHEWSSWDDGTVEDRNVDIGTDGCTPSVVHQGNNGKLKKKCKKMKKVRFKNDNDQQQNKERRPVDHHKDSTCSMDVLSEVDSEHNDITMHNVGNSMLCKDKITDFVKVKSRKYKEKLEIVIDKVKAAQESTEKQIKYERFEQMNETIVKSGALFEKTISNMSKIKNFRTFHKKAQILMKESIVLLNGIRLIEIAVGELDPDKIKDISHDDVYEDPQLKRDFVKM